MKFQKTRFHIDFGPQSLFSRIRIKMADVTEVKTHGRHFAARCIERSIPNQVLEKIKNFSCKEWSLKTCEVRNDTGKFVNSTWELELNGEVFWLTIGFGNVAETIIRKDSSGTGGVVVDGEIYDFVDSVNTDLMIQDHQGSMITSKAAT